MDQQSDFRIVEFTPKYSEAFKRLNVEWITQHWKLEAADEKTLDRPTEHVIDKGGAILIALHQNNPVGSVALIPYDNSTLELAKMAVSPEIQGKGIGLMLGEAALERASRMGAARVYLESNTILGPALSLYQKLGFSYLESATENSPYARCNVRMEKFL
ncbi:MAG: GNAT family N-acetyltransferase [Pseudomonadales bacterium]|jgi:GNAT superfamily N-acetyltransferase|nr:GNAT family N-acetyltransferase [Pseudomonadales bacterium]